MQDKKTLEEFASGLIPRKFHLRKKDEFKDLADAEIPRGMRIEPLLPEEGRTYIVIVGTSGRQRADIKLRSDG